MPDRFSIVPPNISMPLSASVVFGVSENESATDEPFTVTEPVIATSEPAFKVTVPDPPDPLTMNESTPSPAFKSIVPGPRSPLRVNASAPASVLTVSVARVFALRICVTFAVLLWMTGVVPLIPRVTVNCFNPTSTPVTSSCSESIRIVNGNVVGNSSMLSSVSVS